MNRIISILSIFLISLTCVGKDRKFNKLLLNKVASYYSEQYSQLPDSLETNIYNKILIQIPRRNFSIITIPHMYHVVRSGERDHLLESYYHSVLYKDKDPENNRQVYVSTVRKRREALEVVTEFLHPNIYNETVFDKILLSPLVRSNKKYYIYHNHKINGNLYRLEFRPKTTNTMLCKGYAIIDIETGRIESYELKGEYDMIAYDIQVAMGDENYNPLYIKECNLNAKVSYLGNIITTKAKTLYNLPIALPDSLKDADDRPLMATVRPEPLDSTDHEVLKKFTTRVRKQYNISDSIPEDSVLAFGGYVNKKHHGLKFFFMDVIGDNLLGNIKGKFGANDKGSFRIGPLLNPGYFGYSDNKGVIYKLKMRAQYTFSENSDISVNAKYGYAFKLTRAYITIPVVYYFNKRRNGFIKFEARMGNRITNSKVLDEVKKEHNKDSIDFKKMQLDYFKNNHYKLTFNYDLSEKIGVQTGITYYYRRVEDVDGFKVMEKPIKYNTFAPFIQLQYRPFGYKGPFFIIDYERGLKKVMGADSEHGRWEFDSYHTIQLDNLRSWFLRAGMGCYTHRGKNLYFLDYENFRKNDVPEGWDNDWVGEFERLDNNWYNAAEYYFRAHAAYESPLLLLSWIPVVGQVLERERIYVSALSLRRLSPYFEVGYGFTNRVFSMGVFSSFNHKGYDGFGFKFGFELFNRWR